MPARTSKSGFPYLEEPILSHIVTVKTEVRDHAAVAAACRRLALPEPVQGTAQLYSGQASGLLVHLPDWLYPVVIDTDHRHRSATTTTAACWGDEQHLHRFLQAYAVERARIEARKKCYADHRAVPGRRLHHGRDRGGRPGMKKIIRVIVGPKGETKVETKGFSGGECREASRFIEQALGQPVERAAHGRVLPGAAGRAADPAVAVTSASFPSEETRDARHPRSAR